MSDDSDLKQIATQARSTSVRAEVRYLQIPAAEVSASAQFYERALTDSPMLAVTETEVPTPVSRKGSSNTVASC